MRRWHSVITLFLSFLATGAASADDTVFVQRMTALCKRYSEKMVEVARADFHTELDKTSKSLELLDRIADQAAPKWRENPILNHGGLNNQMGCFLAELILETYGGIWTKARVEETGNDFAIRLPDGSLIWPLTRAEKRLALGEEESLVIYFESIGRAAQSQPNKSLERARDASNDQLPDQLP